jgi:hypothetical protein
VAPEPGNLGDVQAVRLGFLLALAALVIVSFKANAAGGRWQVYYMDPTKGVNYEIIIPLREGQRCAVRDCHASSLHVTRGAKFAIYPQTNYRGRKLLITQDWKAGPGTWPEIRSFRVVQEPAFRKPSPPRPDLPTLFGGERSSRKEMALDRDWRGSAEWERPESRVFGVHVPEGWVIRVYSGSGFRGDSLLLRSDVSFAPENLWYGRIRSVKIMQRPN